MKPEIERIFPLQVRESLAGTPWPRGLEEIRVRVGQPLEFLTAAGTFYLIVQDGTCRFIEHAPGEQWEECPYRVTMQEIAEMLSYISSYSLYAYQEELRQGYITIEGGHRIGLAGGVAILGGRVSGISHVAFLNIRVAHEKKGCAREILPGIRNGNGIHNTLILSEPGGGKTTLLRDCIRMISEGTKEYPGMKVCVVDERSELAACHLGIPQNDLGPRTDVLDGCGKPEGMRMLLRAMSPQVIAVDELGGEEDFFAVEQAVYGGSRVLGTVHAGSVQELAEKPYLDRWVERRVFGRYIVIERERGGARRLTLYGARMERLC